MWKVCTLFIIALAVNGIHCDDSVRHATVCEGDSLKIDCQGDQKLEIMAADFGRSAHGVCKGFFDLDWNINCHTAAALEITKKDCEGLQSCTLHASVTKYGEPCWSIKKYLTVSYKCVASKPSDVEMVRICQNGRQRIECPNNRKINVMFANYGRMEGSHICEGVVLSTQCGASTSMSVVSHDCQGKQMCELIATNAKFGGDPCILTHKYLEVKYECKKNL